MCRDGSWLFLTNLLSVVSCAILLFVLCTTGWVHGGQSTDTEPGEGIAVWGLSIGRAGDKGGEGCEDLLYIHEKMHNIPVADN